MFRLMALLFLALASDSFAADSRYQIHLSGAGVAELQKIKRCIDYTVCRSSPDRWSGSHDAGSVTFHLELDANEKRLVEVKCFQPYRNQISIDVQALNLFDEWASDEAWSFVDAKSLEPRIFKKLDDEENKKVHQKILQYLQNGQRAQALEFAIQKYEMNPHNYRILHGDQFHPTYAVTHHRKKTIELGNNVFSSPCEFLSVLRHELEHVEQVRKSNACRRLGKKSTYQYHVYRERGAYFSDIVSRKDFCIDEAEVVQKTFFSYFRLNRKHLR